MRSCLNDGAADSDAAAGLLVGDVEGSMIEGNWESPSRNEVYGVFVTASSRLGAGDAVIGVTIGASSFSRTMIIKQRLATAIALHLHCHAI